jgi:hypothetical protein
MKRLKIYILIYIIICISQRFIYLITKGTYTMNYTKRILSFFLTVTLCFLFFAHLLEAKTNAKDNGENGYVNRIDFANSVATKTDTYEYDLLIPDGAATPINATLDFNFTSDVSKLYVKVFNESGTVPTGVQEKSYETATVSKLYAIGMTVFGANCTLAKPELVLYLVVGTTSGLTFNSENVEKYKLTLRRFERLKSALIITTDNGNESFTPKPVLDSYVRHYSVTIPNAESLQSITITATPQTIADTRIDIGTSMNVSGATTIDFADYWNEDSQSAQIPISLTYTGNGSGVSTEYTLTVKSNDYTPIITKQPQPIICNKGDVAALSVEAEQPIEGSLSYQWMYNGIKITGATEADYQIPTDYAGQGYYYCVVTNVLNEDVFYSATSEKAYCGVNLTYISPPIIEKQPPLNDNYMTTYCVGERPNTIKFQATAKDYGTRLHNIIWVGTKQDGSDKIQESNELSGQEAYPTPQFKAGTYYYFLEIISVAVDDALNLQPASTFSNPVAITFTEYALDSFQGSGTESDPYIISSVADLEEIRRGIDDGFYFFNNYLKLTADIELPVDWQPLGTIIDVNFTEKPENASFGSSYPEWNGINVAPFSGTLDGDGHTITVAEGGLPLFNYVRDAKVKNLNIYGKQIQGAGLVNKSFIDYGTSGNYWESVVGQTIEINNVTLKSGSRTLLSGLVHGTGSGINSVIIQNSVIERDVIIGYDEQQNEIGSFVGEFNGKIENSISYATVKGVGSVGGLAGKKGQAMGSCDIINSAFLGEVIATHDRVGGIIGSGYIVSSAPATELVKIRNSYVAANITGNDKVGGIIGDESGSHYYVDRGNSYDLTGSQSITDNFFYGTLTANGSNVGGIVGYLWNFNKTLGTASNYWYASNAALLSIGGFAPIGLEWNEYNQPNEAQVSGLNLFASAKTNDEFADGTVLELLNGSDTSYKNWIQDTQYPIIDMFTPILSELSISGSYKTEYYIGDDLDLSGAVFTAHWSDGTINEISLSDITISGYDNTTRGVQTLTAAYGAVNTTFNVTVLKRALSTITVYLTLLGDDVHDSDEDGIRHLGKDNNLQVWIPRTAYTVDLNATVADVLKQALDSNNMMWSNPTGNYVESITRNGIELAEFTNGSTSGWVYALNGNYPLLGIAQQFLEEGDKIVFHYTDDYTQDKVNGALNDDSGDDDDDNGGTKPGGGGSGGGGGSSNPKPAAAEVTANSGDTKQTFSDVKSSDWFYSAVDWASANGFMTGTGDSQFSPQSQMTRAMLITVLARANGEDTSGGDTWYSKAVEWAMAKGITDGTNLNDNITREQLVTMLYRFTGEPASSGGIAFADADKISGYASAAVMWAVEQGIITGYEDGSFRPKNTATRAETAAILQRFITKQ